ncbi:MAG: PD-(D/E)XK nuclease family protein [Candidatus Nanoarchaeia archaeon]|jgi:CRISPR/Cas system-associated exonuclease Cas4 (RecB family)|nr:PD-(D/E)XK nuclease family protein [Candidatus Nanoarchaeia archaeon]
MKDYISISASSLSSFFRCSFMYKWQFIDGKVPDKISIYTIFGSVLHKALELHFKYNLSLDEICSSLNILLTHYFSEEKNFEFPSESVFKEYLVKGMLQISNVKKMKERWKDYTILDVEKYIKIRFENKYFDNVFLTGKIDLLLKNLENIICLDWKSSKSKENNIDENIQLTFYMFFVKQLYKYSVENIFGALAYPIDGEILFSQRTENDFSCLFRQINNMLERVHKTDFIKEPKVNMRINDCFFCQYQRSCHEDDRRL